MSGLVSCPADLRAAVEQMLLDLDLMSLEVGLIPASDQRHCGHCVRVVWCHNPGWYRELCAMFPRNRRCRKPRFTDSRVKRGQVRQALYRLLADGTRSQLAWPLLGLAKGLRCGLETEVETTFDDVAMAFGCGAEPPTVAASGF